MEIQAESSEREPDSRENSAVIKLSSGDFSGCKTYVQCNAPLGYILNVSKVILLEHFALIWLFV